MIKKNKLPGGLIAIIIFVFLSALLSLLLLLIPTTIMQVGGIILFLIFIILGIGLIKLNNIARISLIVIYSLSIINTVVTLSFKLQEIIRIIIAGVVIWYLLKPNIIKLFK